jgi:3-deoxy-D-arabino-heptulosonate 7-phosphate (DAHP) synthase
MVNHRLFSREYRAADTMIHLGNITVGSGKSLFIAGSCAVESRKQLLTVDMLYGSCLPIS